MSLWKSQIGVRQADAKVAEHEAKTDPHPQYDTRVQNNLSAAAAPTATDDASAGYEPRSLWFDIAANEVYRCLDAAVGAAVWVKTTLTLDELGSAAAEDAASLRDRSTHTGTQMLATISDAGTAAGADTGDFEPSGAVSTHEGLADPHAQYVQKEAGKGLSTEDYTSSEKTKLGGIEDGATANSSDATLFDRANHTGTQPLSTISDAGTAAGADTGTGDAELPTNQQLRQSLIIYTPDPLRRSVEAASGGRATVHYTAKGQPSYFHVVPKFLCEDIAPGGEIGTGVHPAFLFDGVEESEIFVGMFQMSEVDGEGVSQPMAEPRVSIDWDATRALIQACGPGFDTATAWDWAAVVFWMAANGYTMRGNTDHGRHHDDRWETGRRQDNGVPGDSSGIGNILTGSGPNSWRHDNSPAGIADMVGNVWEWLLGCKMVDGRIFLAADNGIGTEASWVDTGWDMPRNQTWATMDTTGATDDVKRALLVPNGAHDPVGNLYTNLTGERFPLRGGSRSAAGNAGPAALYLSNTRAGSTSTFGSRLRFRNP